METFLQGLEKWWALRTYRKRLPRLLGQRYGNPKFFTPEQVERTIKESKLNSRYIEYAYALFVSLEDFKRKTGWHISNKYLEFRREIRFGRSTERQSPGIDVDNAAEVGPSSWEDYGLTESSQHDGGYDGGAPDADGGDGGGGDGGSD